MKTSQLVEEVSNLFLCSASETPSTGKSAHLKRNICNTKRKMTGERRIGTCREDFELPLELPVTKSRKDGVTQQFLLEDIPGPNRTVIFATKVMLQILAKDCSVWFLDGTFKLAPDWFAQLFTIHALYMNVCVPFVYFLLSGKRTLDYLAVIKATTSSVVHGAFSPEYIISDFELGIIKACRNVFPHVNLQGCLFHLSQSVYRKILSLGYGKLYAYEKYTLFRNAVRSLTALAFVPKDDVVDRFMEVRSFYRHTDATKAIMTYFFETYVGYTWNKMFPIEFWNCYDRFLNKISRSNNAVEGWPYRINSTLLGSHPTAWTCIEKLQKEQPLGRRVK